MHGVGEKQTFLDAGFADGFFTVGRDVGEAHAGGDFERQMFGVGFHGENIGGWSLGEAIGRRRMIALGSMNWLILLLGH